MFWREGYRTPLPEKSQQGAGSEPGVQPALGTCGSCLPALQGLEALAPAFEVRRGSLFRFAFGGIISLPPAGEAVGPRDVGAEQNESRVGELDSEGQGHGDILGWGCLGGLPWKKPKDGAGATWNILAVPERAQGQQRRDPRF